jgi:hypothetical protein
LPLPLMRNRFLVPLWVFIFGMAAVSPRRLVRPVGADPSSTAVVPRAEGTVRPAVGHDRMQS